MEETVEDRWDSLSNFEAKSFATGEIDGRRDASGDGLEDATLAGLRKGFLISLELSIILEACKSFLENNDNKECCRSSIGIKINALIQLILEYPNVVKSSALFKAFLIYSSENKV